MQISDGSSPLTTQINIDSLPELGLEARRLCSPSSAPAGGVLSQGGRRGEAVLRSEYEHDY
jgi:hypothetical protein